MREILEKNANLPGFLERARDRGYSMQERMVRKWVGSAVSQELEVAGLLEDMMELQPTTTFYKRGMETASRLHRTINNALIEVEGVRKNHIPLFSVRVFEPGEHGTTIHRNSPMVGPWAVGITLKGVAPFNVYRHDQLKDYQTIELMGDDSDPTPLDSMEAGAGAAWTLYTAEQLVPHSSGLVSTDTREHTPRELILFYDDDNDIMW